MRAVLDTNVLLSGLLWRGPSYALLEQVRNGVLARPKFDVGERAVVKELLDGMLLKHQARRLAGVTA